MKKISVLLMLFLLGACAQLVPPPRQPSEGHLKPEAPPPAAAAAIPKVVEEAPVLPPPQPEPQGEKYTVVVNEVPVKELLFAIARDANMNIDVNPGIDGVVTLNAVQQGLQQILERISEQVALRYEIKDGTIVVMPDTPFFRSYKVNFVNMSRDTKSTITVSTQIDTGGSVDVTTAGGGSTSSGNNNSTTDVTSTSNQRFWSTLVNNVLAIVGEEPKQATTGGDLPLSKLVTANPETGLLTVMATSRQHQQVQKLLDQILASAERQVLVEATIVEITLSDRYRSGIDWRVLSGDFDVNSSLLAGDLGTTPFFAFNFLGDDFTLNLRLLKEFGDVQVLSSPKLMVLNNQTAMLKVVDNQVFFSIDVETNTTQGVVNTTFDTTAHTVPVGLVMSVTPQINENDAVMLNVRPTISRINGFVNDPNPALAVAGVVSPIPIIQTREMESLLRVHSGQTAVLGGLMRDEVNATTQGIPGLQDVPAVGELFKHRDNRNVKTELVIFLRPTVIRSASLNGDFREYNQYLSPEPEQDITPSLGGRERPCYRHEPGCNPQRECSGPWCQ